MRSPIADRITLRIGARNRACNVTADADEKSIDRSDGEIIEDRHSRSSGINRRRFLAIGQQDDVRALAKIPRGTHRPLNPVVREYHLMVGAGLPSLPPR